MIGDLAPTSADPCVRFWGEPVAVAGRVVGFVLECAEGQAAFGPSGALIGVFLRRAEVVAALTSGIAR